jgi:glycosyltransferase involved in cell wall biosynthesis
MPKLSIVIPVYNEENTLKELLKRVYLVNITPWEKEIIIVNDGSKDSSGKIMKEFQKEYSRKGLTIKVVDDGKNRGKGGALKAGFKVATGDVLLIQDADLEYDPKDYMPILEKFDNKDVLSVYGSRILGRKVWKNESSNSIFYLGGVIVTILTNIFFGTRLTDEPTCYKVFRSSLKKDVLKYCTANDFAFEIQLTYLLSRKGEIMEVPIRYYPRHVNEGKKIKLKDFFLALKLILECKYGNKRV